MKSRSFTLIEPLVVISIVALLSGVVLASLNSARDKARIAAGKQFESNTYHAAADQAVGIWDFDECSGSVAKDRSGYNAHLSLNNGASFSPSTPFSTGCSVSFSGANQCARVVINSANPQLNITDDVTLSAWIYPTGTVTGTIVRAGSVADEVYSLAYASAGNNLLFQVYNGSFQGVLSNTNIIQPSQWVHVAAVRSGTTITFYVNGSVVGGGTIPAPTVAPYSFNIGAAADGAAVPFSGYIDNVRVYGKALTVREVGGLFALEASAAKFANAAN